MLELVAGLPLSRWFLQTVTLWWLIDALEDLGAGLDDPAVNDSRSMVHHPNHGG